MKIVLIGSSLPKPKLSPNIKPLYPKFRATKNVPRTNDGPYRSLGTNVIGPFLINFPTPKAADRILRMNVTKNFPFIDTNPQFSFLQ